MVPAGQGEARGRRSFIRAVGAPGRAWFPVIHVTKLSLLRRGTVTWSREVSSAGRRSLGSRLPSSRVRVPSPAPNRRQRGRPLILLAADAEIRRCLDAEFGTAGYDLEGVLSWKGAFEVLRQRRPDALIAEASLADGPVEDRCREVRRLRAGSHLPLLLLAADASATARERWLEAGADDLVLQPFNAREIFLRVRSLIRQVRPEPPLPAILRSGPLRLDSTARRVTVLDRDVRLTAGEFSLLTELARHAGQVRSRGQLLDRLWPGDQLISARAVDTLVRRVRHKLGFAGRCLRTVRGFGYCLVAPPPPGPFDEG